MHVTYFQLFSYHSIHKHSTYKSTFRLDHSMQMCYQMSKSFNANVLPNIVCKFLHALYLCSLFVLHAVVKLLTNLRNPSPSLTSLSTQAALKSLCLLCLRMSMLAACTCQKLPSTAVDRRRVRIGLASEGRLAMETHKLLDVSSFYTIAFVKFFLLLILFF